MIINNNISIPEGERLQVLLNKICDMQQIHSAGYICYNKSEEWGNCSYGWHNPLFPPEYRHCCLTGEHFEPAPSCDLYYFMAYYYENITGCKAPYNFEINLSWKKHIAANFVEYSPEIRTALINIFAGCTRWQHRKRIPNAGTLIQMDSVKILKTFLFS